MTPYDDALDAANTELAKSMMPHPEEFLPSYSPPAAMLFLRQCCLKLGEMLVAASERTAEEDGDDQPVVVEALNAIAMCIAGSTHGLVALGVLPPEAEEALGDGS